MKKLIAATTLVLSACTPTVVTEFDGKNVIVQSSSASVDPISADEAHRLCASRGGHAKYASSRQIPTQDYRPKAYQHRFRCLSGRRKPTAGGYLNSTSTL